MIVLFTYGRPPQPEYRELAKAVMHDTGVALQPGRWMVNLVPICAFLLDSQTAMRSRFYSNVRSCLGTWCRFQEVGEGSERRVRTAH